MDFFEHETRIIEKADKILESGYTDSDLLKDEYSKLLKSYKKLLKESKKLISISDNAQKRLKIAEEKLIELSITDSLTGLLNRRGFDQWLESELVRLKRNHIPFSLFIIDIDFFKKVNDTHGHKAGDYVLTKLSNLLANGIRAQDCLGRWGGEEFILALPNTNKEGSHILADKLRKIVDDYSVVYNNITIRVTISLGGCTMEEGMSIDDCLEVADRALYHSKENGRNRVTI